MVIDDSTDGSLLHAYENTDACTHVFGPCVFTSGRKIQVSWLLTRKERRRQLAKRRVRCSNTATFVAVHVRPLCSNSLGFHSASLCTKEFSGEIEPSVVYNLVYPCAAAKLTCGFALAVRRSRSPSTRRRTQTTSAASSLSAMLERMLETGSAHASVASCKR